ncbi:hypothetical protein [Paracoccus mutanolyticus]|nr:hypothetical protein [Paracoccus mutanolyticus]
MDSLSQQAPVGLRAIMNLLTADACMTFEHPLPASSPIDALPRRLMIIT